MKKLIATALAISLIVTLQAQDQAATHMYETIYLTPKLDAISTLEKNLSAHNKKYHGEGIHSAFVQTVITGRRTGDMMWAMGPGPFASLDTRPAEGGHDEDWRDNVLPYLTDVSQSEYWRRDAEQYYSPENYSADKIRFRYYKVKRGQQAAFAAHYGKLIQVFKAKKYNRMLSIYWNTFPSRGGRNMVSVSSFNTWADLDTGLPVGRDFNEMHGEGSWAKWLQGITDMTDWMDQEVRQDLPALSGTSSE